MGGDAPVSVLSSQVLHPGLHFLPSLPHILKFRRLNFLYWRHSLIIPVMRQREISDRFGWLRSISPIPGIVSAGGIPISFLKRFNIVNNNKIREAIFRKHDDCIE